MQRPYQLSLAMLLMLLACATVCFATAQMHILFAGLVLMACCVVLALAPVHPQDKRLLVYGAVTGFAAVVFIAVILDIVFFSPGRGLIGLGVYSDEARRYGISVGAVGGAIVAYVGACVWSSLSQRRRGIEG
jgi:hypothetical protein